MTTQTATDHFNPVHHEFNQSPAGYSLVLASAVIMSLIRVGHAVFGLFADEEVMRFLTSMGCIVAIISGLVGLWIIARKSWRRRHRQHNERWTDSQDEWDDDSIT